MYGSAHLIDHGNGLYQQVIQLAAGIEAVGPVTERNIGIAGLCVPVFGSGGDRAVL